MGSPKDERNDLSNGYIYGRLRHWVPDVPKVGEVRKGELSAADRTAAIAWLTANRSRLAFDPKSKRFRVK